MAKEQIPEDLDALDDNDDSDEETGPRAPSADSVEQLELTFGTGGKRSLLVTPMMSLNKIKQLAGG